MAYRQITVPGPVANGSGQDYLITTEFIWLLTFSRLQF